MSSPHRRSRRPPNPAARLADASLPLHLALAYLLVRVYPLDDKRQPLSLYSTTFVSSVLELVAREVLELSDHAAIYSSLRDESDALLTEQKRLIGRYNDKLRDRGHVVSEERAAAEQQESWMSVLAANFETVHGGCAFLDTLEKDVRDRISEDDEVDLTEIPEPIDRRSPIGIFLRGLLLTLRRLSFEETAHLSSQVGSWCGVSSAGPSSTNLSALNRKLAMEDTLAKRSSTMQAYKDALAAGNHSAALAALRRFYDYQFPSAGRGQHQHALLNLASFHYSTGGLESAKEAVDEAIRVARAEGDKACLRHCMSLSQRIEMELSASAFEIGENMQINQSLLSGAILPKASSPMDELWSIQAALDLGEPVHVAMRRIHLALSRYDSTLIKPEDKREPKDSITSRYPFDEGAWHATQAALWAMMGVTSLAEVHEDLALENANIDGDTRLTVLFARAQRMTLAGEFDRALALLCDYDNVEGLTLDGYNRWTRVVWGVLGRQADLAQDQLALDTIAALSPTPPVRLGPGGPSRESLETSRIDKGGTVLVHEELHSTLGKARKMQKAKQPPHLISPLVLSVLQTSEQLGLWTIYHSAVVSHHELLLQMDGPSLASKVLEEISPVLEAIKHSGDEELVARSHLVRVKARLEIAMNADFADSDDDLDEAVKDLDDAMTAARAVGARQVEDDCLTLLSMVAEARYDDTEAEARRAEAEGLRATNTAASVSLREKIRQIAEITKFLNVRVAENWR